ncbi:MAG: DPP IV N-terminal domain-containing protein [Planctomycetota bacterium]
MDPKNAADESPLWRYAATDRYRAGQPVAPAITPDGAAVLFLRSGSRNRVQRLYEHVIVTGAERLLCDPAQLLAGEEETLSVEELARRERMRMPARGIASFQLSPDGGLVLTPVGGRLFVVDRKSGAARELPADGGSAVDARFSPSGKQVACVRDGDVFVIDLETDTQRRLTDTASETLSNGLAEFVAQEEMHRMRGWWWSPDGGRIAFQQTDESAVELLHIGDPFDPGRAPTSFRYPRAGTTNAEVRLGIVDALAGGELVWVDWNRAALPYLATVVWPKAGPLTVAVQNPEQTELQLLAVDAGSGETKLLHTETDDAWLNLDQSFPRWLGDGLGFLWMTERRGARQVELRSAEGAFVREVTLPEDAFQKLLHVDEAAGLLWAETARDPACWQVESFPMDGASRPTPQPVEAETTAVLRKGCGVAVEKAASLNGQTSWSIRPVEGGSLGDGVATLRSEAESPPMLRRELLVLEGTRRYCASVTRPADFGPARSYPVLVSVYGGPGAQMVRVGRASAALDQWMADQGFVVVSADGRGTPARGREWERSIRGDFATAPLEDQVEALDLLCERFPELDRTRTGIYGWSFGGYLSAMAVMRRPDVFHAAVSGAPVVDWHDYDTHYTERYLGLPQQSPEAYRVSDVLSYADDLERPLLLIHGTADDNCYLTGSLKLSDRLLRAGVEHGFLPLAGHTHMVAEPTVATRLYEATARFFLEKLGGTAPA